MIKYLNNNVNAIQFNSLAIEYIACNTNDTSNESFWMTHFSFSFWTLSFGIFGKLRLQGMAGRKSVKPRKYLYLFAAYKQPYQTFPLSLSFSSILISHFCWLYIESQIVQRPTSKLEVDSPILFGKEAEWRKICTIT